MEINSHRTYVPIKELVTTTDGKCPDGYIEVETTMMAPMLRELYAHERASLIAALLAAKISHHVSEDCWYSCPLSEEGCCDERETECTCGAEKHNAAIDAAIARAHG